MADEAVPDDKTDSQESLTLEGLECLKLVDNWSFDVFHFTDVVNNKPIKYLTRHLFDHYGLIQKFSIDPVILENFLNAIETGYNCFENPYHNNMHAADVTQTINSMLQETGLITWLTDLEIFACLLAAIIHDYDHTGTTNGFHIATKSNRALIYNDRSVQENHHLSASFFILQKDSCNILSKLSRDEYRQLRGLVIDFIFKSRKT
ncbi:dual specificity calcium/calmodulin-dependent 3',5'-cyclic nucleotide phosphodiesterase 1-like [Episyrphus balteatus]|uniref:dual specificity calcium/calmodulin-dependent 3',5'-cyclic nucleotide phosphodiesterase 1-like n=1 Tax=Episyrphus balteatus TaxID=286459 RepID=UPI00248564C2|nr:dual specificity calcium/calmodulin-dependent 3',5'-cyclic nucleotide phosphodiesterase 1-like [Episyrphus balteatus]